jgi:hypothetical protein
MKSEKWKEELKTKACPKIKASYNRTLSRSTIYMGILIFRRMNPYGILLRWFSISYGWFAIRNKGWSTESVQTEAKVFPDPTLMDPIIQWNCRCLNINFTVQVFLSIAGVSTILVRYDILHSCVNLKKSAVVVRSKI